MTRRALALLLAAALAGCSRRDPAGPSSRAFDPDTLPDAFARASGALLLPGTTRAFEIDSTGTPGNGAWRVPFALEADGIAARPPARIGALDRWRPVLRWVRRAGDVLWTFEAVAFTEAPPADTALVVSLRVSARNAGAAPHAVRTAATIAPLPPDPVYVAWDAPEPPLDTPRWASPRTGGAAQAWADTPAEGATWSASVTLAPGEERAWRLLLPAYPRAARDLARWALVPHAERVERAIARADAGLVAGTSFALGDPGTEAALRAATLVLLACRERHGAAWVPIGGPFQYRDVWLRDGARAAQALAVAGHGAEAMALARGLATLQWEGGAFLTQRGQLDGTGQALWTFEQVALRGGPAGARDSFAVAGLAAWRWIERQREAGRAGAWRFGGLLPYADPRDGELVCAQLTGNDAWSIAGERALAHLLRAGGRDAQADSVEASSRAYAADFRAALERCGATDVPPSWQRTGRDWGNLAAGWPCAVLPPGDPHLAATAARAWAAAGGAGLTCYGARDSLHGYVGADLGTWALLARRRAAADSVLAALLHWRSASGTSAELFSRAGDFGRNLPPHPTSAAALVVLARNALLFDDADTLRLTLGARAAWWRGAGVKCAPTWWGPLDLAFASGGGTATWRWTAVPVWTELTLPPGTRLAAPPAPPLRAGGRPDLVLAPPGTREARVRIAADGS